MRFGEWSRTEPSGAWRRGMTGVGAFQSLACGITLLFMTEQFNNPAFGTLFSIAPQWVWGSVFIVIGAIEAIYVLTDRLRAQFVPVLITKLGLFFMIGVTFAIEEFKNDHASPWGPINYLTFCLLIALGLIYGGDRHRQKR